LLGFVWMACGLAATAMGQTSYPMLMSLSPVAVQAGTTAECQLTAVHNLYGAAQVLVTGTGVTGEVVPAEGASGSPPEQKPNVPQIKLRVTAAADALPGVRGFRVITPQGPSTYGQLVVVREPVVIEAPNNNTRETAQSVALPATLCGAIEGAEDVDWYRFTATAGSAWTFHVYCGRLQDKIHDLQTHADPILTLRNAAGGVLAASDNHYAADPLLHHQFAADGEYYLEIRDVRFQGNPHWQYAIEVVQRPFVTAVHPVRLVPGTGTRLELAGFNLPAEPWTDAMLPADAVEGIHWISPAVAGTAVNAVPVVCSRLAEAIEGASQNDDPVSAQPMPVPGGVCGRIAAPGDRDCYVFEARQGEKWSFEIVARRVQSAMDPKLRLMNAEGSVLSESDDMRIGRFQSADSLVENWTVPADGRYVLEVTDLHQRGGPDFVYFLQATPAVPDFYLEADTDKTPLAPGTSGVVYVRVYRKNGFNGPVQLAIDGLPPGVTATCGRILPEGNDGCILLSAAPDAPLGAANVRITGIGSHAAAEGAAPIEIVRDAVPLQETYLPGGGRGHWPVEMHTVAVGEPRDLLQVTLSTTEVVLPPGGSQRIDITIVRRPGFTGNVTLDAIYQHLEQPYGMSLPPGVKVDAKNSQTLLTAEQSQGYITLTAAPDAKPVQRQLVPIMAHVSINFVMKATYCGPPVWVTVGEPPPPAENTATP
jgi:hypothetical protein